MFSIIIFKIIESNVRVPRKLLQMFVMETFTKLPYIEN